MPSSSLTTPSSLLLSLVLKRLPFVLLISSAATVVFALLNEITGASVLWSTGRVYDAPVDVFPAASTAVILRVYVPLVFVITVVSIVNEMLLYSSLRPLVSSDVPDVVSWLPALSYTFHPYFDKPVSSFATAVTVTVPFILLPEVTGVTPVIAIVGTCVSRVIVA